jgi:hypothetical protein
MPGVFPDCASNPNSGAERELVLMRWGMRVNNVRQSGQFKTDKTEGRSIRRVTTPVRFFLVKPAPATVGNMLQ